MTRRIQLFSFEQLTAWLIYAGESLYRSAAVRFSLAACILGLSAARVTHSASLYFISAKLPATENRTGNPQSAKNKVDLIDPQMAMGGALFHPPAENTARVSTVSEQSAKAFKLTATLESSSDTARALIETQGEGPREYCAAGESCRLGDCVCAIQNAKILKIAKEQIWLRSGNTQFSLRIGQSSADTQAALPSSEKLPGQTESSRKNTNVIPQTISRENVRRILEGKEGRILEGQFGPHVVEGRIVGYKIARIADDHLFAKLGARSGDIVRKVNGYPLDGMERILDLWKAIQTAPEIKVELERDGKVITYDFQIRN